VTTSDDSRLRDTDVYRDAAIDFPPTESRPLICIEQEAFLVGSGFVGGVLSLARLRIEYRPSDSVLEWVLLLRFLDEFATREVSLEDAAAEIHAHIDKTIAPSELRVVLERIDGPGDVTYRVVAGEQYGNPQSQA